MAWAADSGFAMPGSTEIPFSTPDTGAPPVQGGIPDDTVVDSALKSALREPRERVALLRLETAFIDFCKSDACWLEVGGPFNSVVLGPSKNNGNMTVQPQGRQTSFQRCIVHRLADRFSISRENGVLIDGGSIRLIKRPETRVPSKLLQDLEPSDYSEGLSALNPPPLLSEAQLPGKMKIMKRSSSNMSNSSKKGDQNRRNARSQGSVTDKERAYAEARARIFNDGVSEGTDAPMDEGGDLSTNRRSASSNNLPATTSASSSLYDNSSTSQAEDLIRKNASMSSLETKAVYRNPMEEAADPDFQRGVVVPAYNPGHYYPPHAAYVVHPPPPMHHASPRYAYESSSFPPLAASAPAFYPSTTIGQAPSSASSSHQHTSSATTRRSYTSSNPN